MTDAENPADLGALLRRLVDDISRREGITQAEVARRSGLDPTSLNRSFHLPRCGGAVSAVCRAFGYRVEIVRDQIIRDQK